MLVRGGYRLIPWWCRRAMYRPIVAHFTEHPEPTAALGEPGESADREPADGGLACGLPPGEWEYPEMPAAGFWREQPLPVGS